MKPPRPSDTPPAPEIPQTAVGGRSDPACSAYLDDSLTIGELIRWMNDQVCKAAKDGDFDMAKATARSADKVESAWRVYRAAHSLPNDPGMARREGGSK